MGHAYGTCTLIEIYSLMNLVQDVQNIYMNKHLILMRLFKNVKIIKMQSNSGSIVIHYMFKSKILDHTST